MRLTKLSLNLDLDLFLTQFINVRMVDFSSKENLRRDHGVLIWQKKLSVEETSLIWCLTWTGNLHKEVAGVALTGLSVNSDN